MPGNPPLDQQLVLRTLRTALPFSELDEPSRLHLAQSCTIDFQPKGTRLLVQGEDAPDRLLLVQKGGVRIFVTDGQGREKLVDYRGEGATIGGLTLFHGGKVEMNVETVEDSFFFSFPKEVFLRLAEEHPQVRDFYLAYFSTGYLKKSFDALRTRCEPFGAQHAISLLGAGVEELMTSPPVVVPLDRSIRAAAALMVEQTAGSVLVSDPSGEVIGIVTDKDLRKMIAVGLDFETPVASIMTSPVLTVEAEASCFDALLQMMRHRMHHLAVMKNARVVGMLTSHDIMLLQGRSPMALFREIDNQQSLDGLPRLAGRVQSLVRMLVEEGARAGAIVRMMTVLNDAVLNRLLELLLKEFGPPPVAFCWLLLGSEGRREQTFKTDQDNALILGDSKDPVISRAASYYFEAFTASAIEQLAACGFPLCPGGVMASNAAWRKPLSSWKRTVENWIVKPEPHEVLQASIFFDFRTGFGEASLAKKLRDVIKRDAPGNQIFLRHLAANCLETRPPLSFFRSFIVEKDGEHKNTLDIKLRGIAPVVEFARVLALQYGVAETNTLDRLQQLASEEHLPRELALDAAGAYEFFLQIRLVHQLELLEAGKTPDNRIDPRKLSDLEKQTLKEAFAIVVKIQSFLKEQFRLHLA